jgi:hypothetical protein
MRYDGSILTPSFKCIAGCISVTDDLIASQEFHQGQPEYLEVQQQAPVVDVP